MRRNAVIFLFYIFLFAAFATAQDPAASYVDVTLESSGWAFPIVPMGADTHDDIVVFYAYNDVNSTSLRTRLMRANGTLGPVRILATGIESGMWTTFDVAWHPQISKFLVVYRKDGKLYGRRVGATGSPAGAARLITPYSKDWMALTWTARKKYVLFMGSGGQIVGQVLRKNGKKKKGDVILTKIGNGEGIPLDAATDNDGNAYIVYGHYRSATNQANLEWLSVDRKLRIQDTMQLMANLTVNNEYFLRYSYAAHDPDSDVFAFVCRVAPAHSTYCTFDGNGSFVKPMTNTPSDITPRAILLDPAAGSFAYFYFLLSYNGVTDLVDFHLTSFFPNGTLDIIARHFKQVSNEIDFMGCGISRIGSVFVVWINDGGPIGIHGRLWF